MSYKFQNCISAATMGRIILCQINRREGIDMDKTSTKPLDVNCELLMDVIYGASMGASACQALMGRTRDAEMLGSLSAQLEQYNALCAQARAELSARGQQMPSVALGETGLKLGVFVNTLIDDSPSHIAEMMMEGATMGIIDATRAKNRCAAADAQVTGMAQHLIDIERGNMDAMQKRLN